MPQIEVLGRTLRILHGNSAGTAFTMEVNRVQYIVTAKHLFEASGYPSSAKIGIFQDKHYVSYDVDIRYPADAEIDIAVLKTTPYAQLTFFYPTTFSSANITMGQDVYFLGFPYNYDNLLCNMPGDKYPLPFIKKACLSSYIHSKGIFLLDGHNNPGFSGGPVCFKKADDKTYRITGVIASYRYEELPVYDSNKKELDLFVGRDLSRGLSAKVTDYSINTYTNHLEQSSKSRTALKNILINTFISCNADNPCLKRVLVF